MVKFSRLNLAEETYPAPFKDSYTVDVVFCRNVLMYFSEELRTKVIRRLTHSLEKGGWLIVSPSETAFIQHSELDAVRFTGAILHKKGNHLPPPLLTGGKAAKNKVDPFSGKKQFQAPCDTISAAPVGRRVAGGKDQPKVGGKNRDKTPPENRIKPVKETYQHALTLYEKGRYEESAHKLSVLLSDCRGDSTLLMNHESMALLAKSFANLGRLDEAKKWAEKAVDAEKMHPGHHYLLATIYQEEGHLSEAVKSLKRSLYLDPDFVLAHFALGNLTQQKGNLNGVRKHLDNALSLLLPMDSDEILPYSEGLTAGMLMEMIQSMIHKR